MSWTLNDTTVAGWEIDSARMSLVAQGADVLSIRFKRPCDEPPIAAGTVCTLKWDGTTIFKGRAVLPGGTGNDRMDAAELHVRGPWADLERIIYRTGTGSSTSVRLRFPEDPESTEAVLLEDCVGDVLAHAIGRGAGLSVGSVNLSGEIPSQEFDGLPCSQIIINLLRFSPGAAVWFDYSAATPAIHIRQASALLALSIAGPGCRGLRVDQRTDFAIPGTQLVYRKKVTSPYGEAEGVSVDAAGSVNALGALIMPLDLGAARVEYELLSNPIVVAPLQPALASWWQKFVPDRTVVSVYSHSETGDVALTHYVAANEMASWMLSHIDGVANTELYGCSGPLEESPAAAPVPSDAFRSAGSPPELHIENESSFMVGQRRFTAILQLENGESTVYQGYTLDLPCTDCTESGAYYRETRLSWDPGEPVAVGLASAFQASCARLAYSGTFGIKQVECTPATHRPGSALNITGTAEAAWATMQAPIQSVDHDLILGESQMTFGPASRLGPATLLELARASRSRKTPARDTPAIPTETPTNKYLAVAAANESSGGGGGGADPNTGTLTVNCTDEDNLSFPEGAFVVNGQSGTSGETVTLPVGPYTIVFLPVAQRKTPGSLSGTITAGGAASRDGRYYWQDEAYFEDQSDPTHWTYLIGWGAGMSLTMERAGDSLIISPDGLGVFKSDGRQAFLSSEGWLQLIAGEEADKQIYIDAGVLPDTESTDIYGFKGYQGFGSVVLGKKCAT